jgi:hypothetical protein
MRQWSILRVRNKLMSCLNPGLLSSNETWVNLGIKSQKKGLSESAQFQQAIGDI